MSERTWYSTREVADALGVHVATVRRRIYSGDIPASQIGQTGPWRVYAWWLTEEMDKRRPPVNRPKRRMVIPQGTAKTITTPPHDGSHWHEEHDEGA